MEIALIWLVCAAISASIGAKKGEGISGFFIGLFFGPLGILIALFSKGNRIACGSCKELINKDASKCPKCTAQVTTRK